MADLISRAAAIDAIVSATAFPDAEYIKNLCQNPANSEDWLGGVCDAINAVEDVNAVNAALVVRCRDCKYYDRKCFTCENDVLLIKIDDCGCHPPFRVDDDWFCADGERRESE